jgi:predicted RNase H-like nuclease (RuvC/YqgF family)
VEEYITSEQTQFNYSHNNSTETATELKEQKKELHKLKEKLQVQNKAVEELKKQVAVNSQIRNKVDVDEISKNVMKIMQQQIMVAKMRKGID